MGKTLHENLHGISERVDIRRVLHDVLRSARTPLYIAIFWGVIALLWLWDLFTDYTPFERNPKYKVLVGVLYAMPFLYRSFRGHAEWNFP